ncbi:MAG: OmpA family protein [Cyclobacteriaceae bacterium]
MRFIVLLVIVLIVLLAGGCAERPWRPVNEGREYGNPKTPWVVSHLPEANQWALRRSGHHHVFKRILCFSYPCRKMIGRRKVLRAISFDRLKKEIRKNAKKGAYDKYQRSPVKETKLDTLKLVTPVDTATVAEAVKAPVVSAPILKADSLIILSEFLFETDSYELRDEHYAGLDSLGKFLQLHPTLEVRVSGHTDNTGTERHNVALSTRRAEVVAEYLVDRGANYDRVYFEGFGSSQPIAPNSTNEGRQANRRVEILIRNPRD